MYPHILMVMLGTTNIMQYNKFRIVELIAHLNKHRNLRKIVVDNKSTELFL